MSGNPDRPLTDAQERALIAYADYHDDNPGRWTKPPGVQLGTMEALRKRGYLLIRFIGWTELGQITPDGYALVRGMGD